MLGQSLLHLASMLYSRSSGDEYGRRSNNSSYVVTPSNMSLSYPHIQSVPWMVTVQYQSDVWHSWHTSQTAGPTTSRPICSQCPCCISPHYPVTDCASPPPLSSSCPSWPGRFRSNQQMYLCHYDIGIILLKFLAQYVSTAMLCAFLMGLSYGLKYIFKGNIA